jgi:CHAT domain-containing protein/Tfp pilus assembly protein PilF
MVCKRIHIFSVLIFFFTIVVVSQGSQVNDENNEKLKTDILSLFKSKGEEGLRNYVKKHKDKISNQFIIDLAKAGYKEKQEEWLRVGKIMAEEKKDEGTLADVLYRSGKYFSLIQDNKKALNYFDKALSLFEKVKDLQRQGNVYDAKAMIYYYAGDNSKAIQLFDKALGFFEKTGRPIGLGNSYLGKGIIYFQTGDNLRALEMYDKAHYFYKKAGGPIGQGNLYLCRGNIYLRIGDNLRALEMYDKALPFFEKVGEPLGQGNVYMWKGDIYLRTGSNSRVLEMYDKALPFFEEAGRPLGLGQVFRRKGDFYLRIGDNSKAFSMYNKALLFLEKAGDHDGRGNVYLGKGFIYSKIGNNSKAVEMYDKALIFLKKAEDIEAESIALYGKAKVMEKLGKKGEALDLFEKAIANLEKVRAQTSFSEMKRTFMEKVYDQYEETVMFMLDNKYNDKGFQYAESMRSRVFLDRMAEGLVKLDKGLPLELKENRDKLVAKLSILSKEMNEAAGKNDEKKLKELKHQYQLIQDQFEELLIKIRLNNPLYAAVRYPQPVSVKDLQENVLEVDELLVLYLISSKNGCVFLVSKRDFNVITLDIKEEDMNQIVTEYLLSIEAKNSRRVRKLGRQLYNQLFKPLESSIKNKKEIIIIPDGQLAKIPFESLVIDNQTSNKTVYLLEKYRVKYIQSASALAIIRKHYQRHGLTKRFIGFGDPVYDFQSFEKGKPEIGTPSTLNQDAISGIHRSRYEQEGGIFTRLTSSGEEVNAIANLFKKQSTECAVHLRQDANEANAKLPGLKDFDYIHFACHAILGDGFQSLVLSQMPQSTEDGYLTLNEIMNCDYNAKLVVLSACQTGKGKMEKGEGVTGLTQAVMYAGTPAVVASLWNVEDISTKELMVKFYKYLLEENLSKEDALRKAKLDLVRNKKYSPPFYWSAFVMYGE